MEFICPMCNSHAGFLLMADYTASGLWCRKCGISFEDIEEEFPNIPSGLVNLIDVWVGYWDAFASEKTKWQYEFHHKLYCDTGKYLEQLVNEFYPCVFEDRN